MSEARIDDDNDSELAQEAPLDISTIPRLPLPLNDQKFIVRSHVQAAKNARQTYPTSFILNPKDVLDIFVRELTGYGPEYIVKEYLDDTQGEESIIKRAFVEADPHLDIVGIGDDASSDRAQSLAALHAILWLIEGDLISRKGQPQRPGEEDISSGDDECVEDTNDHADDVSYRPPMILAPPPGEPQPVVPLNSCPTGRPILHCDDGSQIPIDEPVSKHEHSETASTNEPSQIPIDEPISNDGLSETASTNEPAHEGNGHVDHDIPASGGIEADVSSTAPIHTSNSSVNVNVASAEQPAKTLPTAPFVILPGPAQIAQGISLPIVPGHSNGVLIDSITSRDFFDYYCKQFGYGTPEFVHEQSNIHGRQCWTTILSVNKQRIGAGSATTKVSSTDTAFVDACSWLAASDPALWARYKAFKNFKETVKSRGAAMALNASTIPSVAVKASERLENEIRDVVSRAKSTELFKRATELEAKRSQGLSSAPHTSTRMSAQSTNGYGSDEYMNEAILRRSYTLREQYRDYREDHRMEQMRRLREDLPVFASAEKLLASIDANPVLIVSAATGSGKTTQIPQIILDDHAMRGIGGQCNIICTQPRRLAAISVAQRIASERGEKVGSSVGYNVRFEAVLPERYGSITFCTTGTFLKRLQPRQDGQDADVSILDEVTHILVDEVHERDVDVDLLLYVLRRESRRRVTSGRLPFKIVLMSATVDPSLFQRYLEDPHTRQPAPVISIPGRAFPVTKHGLDDTVTDLRKRCVTDPRSGWVFEDPFSKVYLDRELYTPISADDATKEPLKQPTALIALVIAHVCLATSATRDGHILVFLPGFEEIRQVQRQLLDNHKSFFDLDFTQYELHILHSAVPLADQQAVMTRAPPGCQRIILATNIAETSVTIPDVVYVVDAGTSKQKCFDPMRHLSSMICSFTGRSNMAQRAGRAGRHRPGQCYSLVSAQRMACLPDHQVVEMKRLDLSNVVMHIKGLGLPMEPEEVLAACIEPPDNRRVVAAINTLTTIGALDAVKHLTPLGQVLLQLPVDAAIGRLCLLGCFFRCLDQAVTIAAILSERDPFVSPIEKRALADAAKRRFSPNGYVSDTLTVLKAYNEWEDIPVGYERDRFCDENFLARNSLRTMQKVKEQIMNSLDRAGVLKVAMRDRQTSLVRDWSGQTIIPSALNSNGECLPMLAALIAAAVAPRFAVRKSLMTTHTRQDASAVISPNSVLAPAKRSEKGAAANMKELYAYSDATTNKEIGEGTQKHGSFLRGVSIIDPFVLLLFGAHKLSMASSKYTCDGWLPLTGSHALLSAVQSLKNTFESCLFRLYEGLSVAMSSKGHSSDPPSRADDSEPWGSGYTGDDWSRSDGKLGEDELHDLDHLSEGIINVLRLHAAEQNLPAYSTIARIPTAHEAPLYTASAKAAVSIRGAAGTTRAAIDSVTNGIIATNLAVQPADGSSGDEWAGWKASTSTNNAYELRKSMTSGRVALDGTTPAAPPAHNGVAAASATHQPSGEDAPKDDHASHSSSERRRDVNDEWASYTPIKSENDAYAKRASMNWGDKHQPALRPESPQSKGTQGTRDEPADGSSKPGIASPVADADDGWDMSYKFSRLDINPSIPELRLPEPLPGARTTGWKHYDPPLGRCAVARTNRHRGDAYTPAYDSTDAAGSNASRTPRNDDQSNQSVPSVSADTSWDTWQPQSSTSGGEDAYRRRASLGRDKGTMHNRDAPAPSEVAGWATRGNTSLQTSMPNGQGWQPRNGPRVQMTESEISGHSSRHGDGRTRSPTTVRNGWQQDVDTSVSRSLVQADSHEDSWDSYRPAKSADAEGQAAWARRAAMTQGPPSRDSDYARLRQNDEQSRSISTPNSASRPSSEGYNAPSTSADSGVKAAYVRRTHMSAGQSYMRTPSPVASGSVRQSTLPAATGELADSWASYKPKVSAEVEGQAAYARRVTFSFDDAAHTGRGTPPSTPKDTSSPKARTGARYLEPASPATSVAASFLATPAGSPSAASNSGRSISIRGLAQKRRTPTASPSS